MKREDIVEKEIPVSQLQVGMHVVRLDRPWEETTFLLQGFILQSEEDVLAVQSQCKTVVIEGRVETALPPLKHSSRRLSQKHKAHRSAPETSLQTSPRSSGRRRVVYINKVDFSHEMETASLSYKEAKATANNIMSGLRLGRALDMNQVRNVVNHCVSSIFRNDNALLLLTKIKNKDEYTAEHSINVSILAAAFGKSLGLLEKEIRNLALCGLLHDVGKVGIENDILNKPGRLTPEEFDIIKRHTTLGRDLLAATAGMADAAVDVAHSHHERVDGKGYPRGLREQQIPLFAQLVGIVDTYDAITSSRIYGKGRSSMEALKIIHGNQNKHFNADLAIKFIRMIGIYPPGSIVEMTNGEVAIVVESHASQKLYPRVLLVRDAGKRPLAAFTEIDLKTAPSDKQGRLYRIAREVPDDTYGIEMKTFIEQGIFNHRPPISGSRSGET